MRILGPILIEEGFGMLEPKNYIISSSWPQRVRDTTRIILYAVYKYSIVICVLHL